MRTEGVVAEREARRGLNFQPRPVAVIPLWRSMQLQFAGNFELRCSPQRLSENGGLDLQLVGIIGVLIVASPAALKIWAARRNALRRRLEHRFEPRPGKTRLFLGYCGFDLLAFEDKRNKDALAPAMLVRGQASQSVPAINQLLDLEAHSSVYVGGAWLQK